MDKRKPPPPAPAHQLRLTARQRCSAQALGLSPLMVSLLQRRAANSRPL